MCDAHLASKYAEAYLKIAVFGFGVAVGRLAEKFERLYRNYEDKENKSTRKNDRQ